MAGPICAAPAYGHPATAGPLNVGVALYRGPLPSHRLPKLSADMMSYGEPYSGPTTIVASFASQSVPLLSRPQVCSKPRVWPSSWHMNVWLLDMTGRTETGSPPTVVDPPSKLTKIVLGSPGSPICGLGTTIRPGRVRTMTPSKPASGSCPFSRARIAANAEVACCPRLVAAASTMMSTHGSIALSRKSKYPPLVSSQNLMTDRGPVISIFRQASSEMVGTFWSCRARTMASLKARGMMRRSFQVDGGLR